MREVMQLDHGRQARFVEVVTLLLAVWLAVSPFVLRFERGTAADVVDFGIGILVGVVTFHQLNRRIRHPGWSFFCAVLGLMEMLSPWVFAYTGQFAAVRDAVLFGGLIAVFAFWSGCAMSDFGRRQLARP